MKHDGVIVWKSFWEYNPESLMNGDPYFLITSPQGGKYCFWRFNLKKKKYEFLRQGGGEDFENMVEEADRKLKKMGMTLD